MPKPTQKFRYLFSLIIIWSLVSLIFTTISYFGGRNEGRIISIWIILADNFYRYGLWGFLSPLVFLLTKKFDFQSKAHYLRNFSFHILLSLLFSTVHFIGYAIASWFTYAQFRERESGIFQYFQDTFLGNQYLGLLIYAVIVFASQAYLRNKNLAQEEKKASLLQSQLVEAQLQALKMQLQPHFLFNTLNSISSLVTKNPIQAQTMIAKLGDFLRMTLDFNKSQMVLLREELQFLRSYLEIEQTRFSEKLQVIFNVNEDVVNAVVPHLALQPIVENSVKHGISQMTEGGKIEIIAQKFENKLRLQVKDNGPAGSVSQENDKTGLSNIKARLKHLYGDDFSFEMKGESGRGMTVTLVIPLSFDFAATEEND
jgi:two-component system, LytTR family, sensor kinase